MLNTAQEAIEIGFYTDSQRQGKRDRIGKKEVEALRRDISIFEMQFGFPRLEKWVKVR